MDVESRTDNGEDHAPVPKLRANGEESPRPIPWLEQFGGARGLIRRLGPVGPLAAIAASLPAINGFIVLASIGWLGPWLEEQGTAGFVIYVSAFTLLAGLALLPTYATALLAGRAFGLQLGSGLALMGIVGAAAVGYLVARRASGDRVVQIIESQPKWKAVYEALVKCRPAKGLAIITLLRVPPNSPFAIANLVMATCKVRPWTYLIGTLVGIAPRTVAAVFIGQTIRAGAEGSKPAWYVIGGIVLAIVVVIVIGVIANRAIVRMTQPQDGAPEPALAP